MPVTVEIDGLGKVELDDSFKSKSAAEQEQIISDIVSQARPQSQGGGGASRTGRGGYDPRVKVVANGKAVALSVYPDLYVTENKRDPNSPLGRKNPSSWHNHTAGAIDARAIPGMSFEEYLDGYRKAGYTIVHARDEYANPAPHATGGHWHVVLGPKQGEDGIEIDNPEPPPADPAASQPGAPTAPTDAPPQQSPPPSEESWGQSIASGAHDLVKGIGEGWTDFQNDATGLLLRGTDAIGLTEGSLARFDKARKEVEDPAQDARYVNPDGWSRTIGNVGGNIVAGAPLAELKGLQALGAVGKLGRYGDMAIQGAAAGAVTSGGHDIPENMAIGAALAPALGGAVDLGKAATPAARATRFANKQASDNPFAAFDAEIAQDIIGSVERRAVSGTDPKGRASVTAKTLNSIEGRYTAEFRTLINKLDAPDADKMRLKEALSNKFSLPQNEVDALRGTVGGDAIADAITKVQRFRQLTPELKRDPSAINGLIAKVGYAADLAPLVGLPGTYGAATGARSILGKLARRPGDGEAARVHAAEKIIARKRGYEKLSELVGPSGQKASQKALWDAAERTASAKQAQAAEAALKRQQAKEAAQKLKADNSRVGVQNNLDNIKPGGGFRGFVYERTGLLPDQQDTGALKALSQGKITPEQFDAFLKSPDKLMQGNAGNALVDRFAAMADEGHLSRDPNWKPATTPTEMVQAQVDAQGQPIRSMPAYQAGVQKNIAREMPILQELDAIHAERTARIDSDPEYAKIAGTDQDPYVQRIISLRSALDAMKAPNKPK